MAKRILSGEAARKNASNEANALYAAKLKRMVDCRTVWTSEGTHRQEFERFYKILSEDFPLLHERAERLVFGDGCFFFLIRGANARKNVLLMSHHDVVDGGEGWDTEPFEAVIKDGRLYGRGTVDTKTPLFAELQAAEELLAEGWDFEGINLYIGSSHNEEMSGDGMVLAAEHFKNQGLRFDLILDEGGAITTGMIPGVSAKSAVIAVHEKGRHAYRCSVKEEAGGHGGLIPGKGSVVSSLSAFIAEVEKGGVFKADIAPEVRATFKNHAPYMSFPLNFVFGNFDLFKPLIRMIMMKIPQAAAMLSTGCVFTAFKAGDAENPHIKAGEAEAFMFLRCVREESLEKELCRIREIGKKHGVVIEEIVRDYCRPSSFDSPQFKALEALLHESFPDVITAPFLLTAGTDARRFGDLADSILRFAPIDLDRQQFASIHSSNENIRIENIGQCVLFYKDFIKHKER